METPFTLAGLALQAPTIKKQIELSLLLAPTQAARLASDAAGAGPFAVAGLAAVAHLESEWAAQDREAFEAAEKRDRAIIAAALTKWTYEHKPSQAAIIAAYNLAQNYLESAELDPEFTAHYAYLSGAALHSKFPNSLSFEEFLADAGAAPVGYDSPLAAVVARPVPASTPALAPPPAPVVAASVMQPAPAAPLAHTPAAIVRPLPAHAPDGELSANCNPLKASFTLAQLDKLAKAVELIDESGRYTWPRGAKGLSAVVGFAQALYDIKVVKSACNRKELVSYLGQLFGVEVRTNGAASIIAKEFRTTTESRAKTLFPDLFKPEKRKESE